MIAQQRIHCHNTRYIETGLEHLSDRDSYDELEKDQTKQVAEQVTQVVRSMYQEGHIDKPTAEYLLPPLKTH